MIWLIVLAVWLIASIWWWHAFYKEHGFLRVCDIYQGFFAGIPGGIVTFHEYLDKHWRVWNHTVFINKKVKEDIDFLHNEMDQHIKNAAKELIQEIDREIKKDETRRNIKKKTKNKK